jgi:hypothetical protein
LDEYRDIITDTMRCVLETAGTGVDPAVSALERAASALSRRSPPYRGRVYKYGCANSYVLAVEPAHRPAKGQAIMHVDLAGDTIQVRQSGDRDPVVREFGTHTTARMQYLQAIASILESPYVRRLLHDVTAAAAEPCVARLSVDSDEGMTPVGHVLVEPEDQRRIDLARTKRTRPIVLHVQRQMGAEDLTVSRILTSAGLTVWCTEVAQVGDHVRIVGEVARYEAELPADVRRAFTHGPRELP